jgi:hypothetical protein
MGAYENVLGYPVSYHPRHLPEEQNGPGLSVFPNPSTESFFISYHVRTGSEIEISIYNSMGQCLETLVSMYQPAGIYQMNWDAGGYTGGTYFCRIRTGGEPAETVTLILLK